METTTLTCQEPSPSLNDYTDEEIDYMRKSLMTTYPGGIIRSQYIDLMSDAQIIAIFRWHRKERIPMDKPRMKKPKKQIPGQMSLLSIM